MYRYFVYIMCSRPNGALYIGLTNDIARRLEEHQSKAIQGFTSQYDIERLVYLEEYEYIDDARQREKQLKKWNRAWKIRLIEEANPEWKDLQYHLL